MQDGSVRNSQGYSGMLLDRAGQFTNPGSRRKAPGFRCPQDPKLKKKSFVLFFFNYEVVCAVRL